MRSFPGLTGRGDDAPSTMPLVGSPPRGWQARPGQRGRAHRRR